VLSNDRLRLGVGISPWPEDFAAMGLPWEKRGVRMDEPSTSCAASPPAVGSNTTRRVEARPVQDHARVGETDPILIGGHSAPALRRAAQRGDGGSMQAAVETTSPT